MLPITHINLLTKEAYSAGNAEKLEAVKQAEGFNSNKWITFVQARQMHIKIKKGAKATQILIPAGVTVKTKTDANGNETEEKHQNFKRCYVFNESQTEKTNAEQKAEAQAKAQPELPEIKTEAPKEPEAPKQEAKQETKAEEQKAGPEQQAPETEANELIEMLKNKFKTAV